jgi:hypothetical protein
VGTVGLLGGDSASNSTSVSLDVTATDPAGVDEVALSNDGAAWTTSAYAPLVAWTVTSGDGPKPVSAKWRDGLGNWSLVKSTTIELDTTAPSGSISIASGAVATTTANVSVDLPAQDTGSGVSQVALSNDGLGWTTRAYAPGQAWSLPSTDGIRTVWAKWRDAAGNWSATSTDTILLDTVAPSATTPQASVIVGGALVSGRLPVRLGWSASDVTSGIDHFVVAESVDGRAWTAISSTLAASSMTRNLAPGHAYRFRVQAIDHAGNAGTWAYGSTFVLRSVQQSSSLVHYRGTWATSTWTGWWGGTAKSSSTRGSTASFTFFGKSIAWVGLKAATRGKAYVYINGVLKATVDLYSATTLRQRIVWSSNYATSATRTITIKVVGTSGRPRVDIDGFVVAS